MKIAIVRLSSLGDIIHSLIVLEIIKAHQPHAHITWIVDERFYDLIRYHPLIDKVVSLSLKGALRHPSMIITSWQRLRHLGAFDLVIDLQGLLKSSLIARILHAPVGGFGALSTREPLAALLYDRTIESPRNQSIVFRYFDLLRGLFGWNFDNNVAFNKQPLLHHNPTGNYHALSSYIAQEPPILLIPGSNWEAKNWPAENYAKLTHELPGRYLILWGNERERAVAEAIACTGVGIKIAPKLRLDELIWLIGHVRLVIGGDTGPTHMAWALNRPSIVLWGATSMMATLQTPINIAITSESEIDEKRINKNNFSIRSIPVATVAQVAQTLLDKEQS
ncbi:MAG: lipopolysaccharide heptosyltransferase I [Campylobacterales bacterium]